MRKAPIILPTLTSDFLVVKEILLLDVIDRVAGSCVSVVAEFLQVLCRRNVRRTLLCLLIKVRRHRLRICIAGPLIPCGQLFSVKRRQKACFVGSGL